MSKELYEATIEYTKDYNGESWIATISDEKYIDMDTFERTKADLEAKLAEKNKIIESQYNGIGYWKSLVEKRPDFDYVVKIKDLEQQLAEKKKEYRESVEKILSSRDKFILEYNQDKISFAVEQLEKVKEWVDEMFNGWKTNEEVNQLAKDGICLALENVGYKIDNQIKQLKENK